MGRRMAMTRTIGLAAVSLITCLLSACGTGTPAPVEQSAQSGPPIAVTLAPVVASDASERLEAGGVVAARESATLSSRIVATVASVRVRAGDRVRTGDVVVTLDARESAEQTGLTRASATAADRALSRARSEHTAAEAEHRLAAAWQTRMTALHARKAATDHERDEAEARLAAAAARMAGTRAGIDAAEAHLAAAQAAVGVASATESYTTVRAPFDGLITERLTDPGNLAAPGVPLLRIESGGARQVVGRVDEARAGYVRPGDRVTVLLDARDQQTTDERAVDGVVAEVARAAGADQRAFTVKVNVPANVTARSGTFARIVFPGAARRALYVPPQAIRRQGQVASVFVVQDGTARLRLIQAGAPTAAGVEVLSGLDAGEPVVTSSRTPLADGVRVVTGAPAAEGGTP